MCDSAPSAVNAPSRCEAVRCRLAGSARGGAVRRLQRARRRPARSVMRERGRDRSSCWPVGLSVPSAARPWTTLGTVAVERDGPGGIACLWLPRAHSSPILSLLASISMPPCTWLATGRKDDIEDAVALFGDGEAAPAARCWRPALRTRRGAVCFIVPEIWPSPKAIVPPSLAPVTTSRRDRRPAWHRPQSRDRQQGDEQSKRQAHGRSPERRREPSS